MGLVYTTAKNLLRQIVGYQGFTGTTTYLALSSTKPTQCPATPTSTTYADYNITEPSEASYSRVALVIGNQSQYFNTEPTATEDPETGKYTFTIANDREIHFPECTDASWCSGQNIGYFAIFTTPTKGQGVPIYVGEIEEPITVTENTVPLIRVGNLSISVE